MTILKDQILKLKQQNKILAKEYLAQHPDLIFVSTKNKFYEIHNGDWKCIAKSALKISAPVLLCNEVFNEVLIQMAANGKMFATLPLIV